jgi:hypothetical protein
MRDTGRILISERVRHFVKDLVYAESVGTLTLKGFQKPVAAYNVAGLAELRPATRKEQAKGGVKRSDRNPLHRLAILDRLNESCYGSSSFHWDCEPCRKPFKPNTGM